MRTTRFSRVKRVLQLVYTIFPLLLAGPAVSAQSNKPALYYATANAGPNHGWANSSTQGAAVTVWGKNLGSTRGNSYLAVGTIRLTKATDYAEWGATTNPKTAKAFQRITFWLNRSMPLGAANLTVTVDGVTSNALAFTIDNTAVGRIRFVDPANGSESYDGQYPDHSLGGRHGPWLYPFSTSTRKGEDAPGMFMYLRGGTYTKVQETGWHAPRGGIIGAPNTGCQWYYPQKNGSDALRMTMTSYPGEHAHFFNSSFWSMSHYWTFANFSMDADLTYQGVGDGNIYMAIVIGWQEAYCKTEISCQQKMDVVGNQVIGLALIGNIHIGIQVWGSNHNLFANYIANMPTQQGGGLDHSYNLYLATTTGLTVKDNELHNGSRYNIHAYDETRNCNPLYSDMGRRISDLTIDSNLIDMNQANSPQCDASTCPKWYGMILGLAWDGGTISNVTLKNNVFYVNDGSPNPFHAAFSIYEESAAITLNGVYFYNNTVYGTKYGVDTMQATKTAVSNVDVRNNIFFNVGSPWHSQSMGRIVPTWSYNLTDRAMRFSDPINNQGHNLLGNPLFASPKQGDFRVPANSPAAGAGIVIIPVNGDMDGNPRTAPPTIGAFEAASEH